jgi:hypothetical protein
MRVPPTQGRTESPSAAERHERLTARTLRVWQRFTARPLTNEDAQEITENCVGYFRMLLEWDETLRAASRRRQ